MWPSPQEYNEAIQNPDINLRDPELSKCTPQLNRQGLPVPNTGAFATVYRLSNGNRSFAVRCFLNYYPDQENRYSLISNHLNSQKMGWMVPFEFQKEGIRVNGNWYPVLKMEWIEGERIDVFIYNNLGNPAVLADMSQKWLSTVASLRSARIAHGDLQHGNILIRSGSIKLIDYDGMFVPQLDGLPTHEVGHRNFQHPKRTNSDYGIGLDNFSAWVIYVSLVGFSLDKNLWAHARAGDESLLFSAADYLAPDQSMIVKLLKQHSSEKLKRLAEQMHKLPSMPVLGVEELGYGVKRIESALAAASSAETQPGQATTPAFGICPRCKKKLRRKTVPGTFIAFWECEDSPLCSYQHNEGDDVAPIEVPPPPPPAPPSGAPLVFIDPTATGNSLAASSSSSAAPGGASSGAQAGQGNPPGGPTTGKPGSTRKLPPYGLPSPPTQSASTGGINTQQPPTPGNTRKPRGAISPASKTNTTKCPLCGAHTIVTCTVRPMRICFNFPNCSFKETC